LSSNTALGFLVFYFFHACDVAFKFRGGLKIRKGTFVREKHLELSFSFFFSPSLSLNPHQTIEERYFVFPSN